jgi:two-component system, OmpR family, response regulator
MKKPTSILVVDDDQRLCDLLRRYLRGEGYRVITALNGEQMRRHIEQEIPDLVLLDLILPGEDGLLLAKELRIHKELGIIILTAKGETVDRIVGLEVGADDYISKPFDNRELLARIRSVLRRLSLTSGISEMQKSTKSVAYFSDWTLELTSHELVSPAGEHVHLTSNEFKLLSIFIKSNNRVLNRDQLLELLAEREWNPDDRSVDVLVGKLRKKIEQDQLNPVLIKTIRGTGYLFTAPVKFK